jgi:hypothetical protein
MKTRVTYCSPCHWWKESMSERRVCRRPRNVILGSLSYLNLSLVCTYGTPIADPFTVDYFCADRDITTEEEDVILHLVGMIASAASVLRCLFRICRDLLRPPVRNVPCWNTRLRLRTRVRPRCFPNRFRHHVTSPFAEKFCPFNKI